METTLFNIFTWLNTTDGKALFISILATVVGGIILKLISARPKLTWAFQHGYTFLVPIPDQFRKENQATNHLYKTNSYYFFNSGHAPAKNIEIIFNFPPPHFEIFPVIPYKIITNPDGRFIISVESLAYRENFNLEQIGVGQLPEILNVRSSTGKAIEKEFFFVPKPKKTALILFWTAVALGIFSMLYHGTLLLIR